MIIAIISIVISFLLDCFFSNNIAYSITSPSWFSTIYTVICLLVLFPYFDNRKKYLYLLFGCGIIFDVVYTGTILVNLFIFVLLYLMIKTLNFWLPNNILMANIISIIGICMYHGLSYVILSLVKYNVYDISLLLKIITHSIIATVIYTSLLYITIKKIYDKFNIKQIK